MITMHFQLCIFDYNAQYTLHNNAEKRNSFLSSRSFLSDENRCGKEQSSLKMNKSMSDSQTKIPSHVRLQRMYHLFVRKLQKPPRNVETEKSNRLKKKKCKHLNTETKGIYRIYS